MYLERGKKLLRGVIQSRKWLMANQKGFTNGQWAVTELRNMEHALGTIHSAHQMQTYLERKETTIRLLINARHKSKYDELRYLIQKTN
jgi:hypothetical protein